MIEELRISGLGVIEDARLEFGPGLTVVTGETGAGKTMIVSALGLLLGGRSDAGVVREGAGRALVEGQVHLADGHPAMARADDAGADLEDGRLMLARTVSASGRSRAHVGGRSAPVSVLSDLGRELVAVHGQSDQQRLLQPMRQRAALDRFAGDDLAADLDKYRADFARLREVEAQVEVMSTQRRQRAQEADLLRYGLAEVLAVGPSAEEDVELAREAERLRHVEDLASAAAEAQRTLLGDGADGAASVDATGLVAVARRALEPVRGHDRELSGLADRLAEVSYLMSDVAADLASYASSVEADPIRLATVEDRRACLGALTRKYGDTIDEVLAWTEESAERLAELESDDSRSTELEAEATVLTVRLTELAARLSLARREAAGRFATMVTDELTALAMPDARVTVAVSSTPTLGPNGTDEIEILLSAHPGAPDRPIARGASGGELSRVMLAVEVVFAGADPVPTLVFDEVDAGVGGRAAVEVGARLARLARTAQVLVVTHLPQVAAYADQHLLVEKSSNGAVTSSGVITLDGPGRVRELTRMLAGLADSESGAQHARELLETATLAKAR